MFCLYCGHGLSPGARFCGACGRAHTPPAEESGLDSFIGDISVSLKEAVLLDRLQGSEILRSPVFRFLAFVAIVPLAIQILDGNKAILYGLALWSMALWSMLLYRLFADRDLTFRWAMGTVLFTCFIGLPILEVWLIVPPDITGWLTTRNFLAFRFTGYVFGVGIREELCKAIPLFLMALFTAKMKNPVNGLVLGMMSGIGFAGAENVYYVFQTLERALDAMKQTGQAGYLVMPVYNNVVRMAMTPFLHGCFSAIFGYFIALAVVDARRRVLFLLMGLGLSSFLHGLYDTVVGESALLGVGVQVATFFLVMTYILKARGLTSARELGGGIFSRTVSMRAVSLPLAQSAGATPPMATADAAFPHRAEALTHSGHRTSGGRVFLPDDPPTIVGNIPPFAPPQAPSAVTTGMPSVVPASWRLRGTAGPLLGQSFPLSGQVLLGRDPDKCAVHVDEPTVSREHAAVEPDPTTAAWRIRRVSRTGYLYLNGAAVDQALLAPGDQIQLGTSIFVLEVG